MKHGKLGIKELHTGRNVCVLLYNGLVPNVRVAQKAMRTKEWLATESVLGKPETREHFFTEELRAILSSGKLSLTVSESDLLDRVHIFRTKERAIKWAKQRGRETSVISGEEMIESLQPCPNIRSRIVDDFGAKGTINECGSRLQMVGRTHMQILQDVVEKAKDDHKQDYEKLSPKRYPTDTLSQYISTVVSEVMRLHALSYIEFIYDEECDEVTIDNAVSKLGDLPVPMDSIKEMLHVACGGHLSTIRVEIIIKDDVKRVTVKV